MDRKGRIAEQLGMPQGTANNKLRKNILFSYVVKAGDNFCHKCGAEIETVDDFSIEHKMPWEGRDAALFWAIDNISFSHVQCNRPHARKGTPKKIGPPGTAWCHDCQDFLPVDNFYKNTSRWDGFDDRCKTHQRMRRIAK